MIVVCNQCGIEFDRPLSHVMRVRAVFCSKTCHNASQNRRIRLVCPICSEPYNIRPCEVKKYHTCSMRCARQYRRGKNNPNWQGGMSQSRRFEMSTAIYKNWRKAVFKRDNYTCIDCGKRGGPLEADHSKTWAKYPDLRYEVSNGVTRCKKCHVQRHTKHEGRYIAVDFDGTLATWGCPWPDDYRATGEPIPAMVERVKRWIAEGEDVRIFTARMDGYHPIDGPVPVHLVRKVVEDWCQKHIGAILPVTNRKDYWCKAIYDDRAYQVERDTGRIIGEEPRR